jgi:hypothetical protein
MTQLILKATELRPAAMRARSFLLKTVIMQPISTNKVRQGSSTIASAKPESVFSSTKPPTFQNASSFPKLWLAKQKSEF